MFRKLIGLSLAMMLGFGTVGCMSTQEEQQPQQEYVEQQPQDEEREYKQEQEYVEEQPSYQEQPQDEDVSDYYLENRVSTNLENAKEYVENFLKENGLDNSFKVVIDESNNRLYIVCKASTENVASWINDSSWNDWVEIFQKATEMFHQILGVDIAMVMITEDGEGCYLSAFNGEIMFNVEEELEKRGY